VNPTHQQQHAGVLSDRPAAAQEADDEQHRADGDQQVAHVEHLAQLRRRALDFPEEAEDGAAVHLHPDAHAQDGGTGQLGEGRGEREGGRVSFTCAVRKKGGLHER